MTINLLIALLSLGSYASADCLSDIKRAHDFERAGKTPEALTAYFEGLACNPNVIEGQFTGDLVRFTPPAAAASIPDWERGESLAGKTLLVYAVKGNGDTLQFVRFAPRLRATKVRKVILAVPGPLQSLIAHSLRKEPWITVRSLKDLEHVSADRRAHLLSLPAHLGVEDIATEPYLEAPEPGVATPGLKRNRFNVGLIFYGDRNHPHDKDRSFRPADLAGLAGIENVTFYSLQYGDRKPITRAHDGLDVDTSLVPKMKNYADTASLIRKLNLVISADTSVSHLAAALGAPTLVPLPLRSDLRYTGQGPENLWYASMKLFRQTRAGDWTEPMASIAAEVRSRALAKLTKSSK